MTGNAHGPAIAIESQLVGLEERDKFRVPV